MSGNGQRKPCAHPDKQYFRDEDRPDGTVLRHWICPDCLQLGADPQ